MIRKAMTKIKNLAMLAVLLPFVYGCNGGGSSLGSLLGGSGGDGGSSAIGLLSGGGGAGESLAMIHNPEPATMLLLGSGVVAMRYFRHRKNQKR